MDSSLYNSFHTLLNWQSNSLWTVHVNVRCLWKKLLVVLGCCEWGRNISSSMMSLWKPKITQVCSTIPNLWNNFLLFSFFISVFPLHTLLVPSFIPQILQHIQFQIGQYRPHIFYKIVHLNHIIAWFISWGLESKTNTGHGRKNSSTPVRLQPVVLMLWILFTRADLLLYHIFLPLVIENRQPQAFVGCYYKAKFY